MAQQQPDCQPVVADRSELERSPDQAAHEAAMTEIAETLANLEQAIRRAERARKAVALLGRDRNAELALQGTLERLQAVHQTLFQEGYFGGDQQWLI